MNKIININTKRKSRKKYEDSPDVPLYVIDCETTSFDTGKLEVCVVCVYSIQKGQYNVFDAISHPYPPPIITPRSSKYIGSDNAAKLLKQKPFILHFREFYLSNPGLYFAHNGSNFDFEVLDMFNDMDCENFLARGGRILTASIKHDTCITDSMNIYPLSLSTDSETKTKLQIFAKSYEQYTSDPKLRSDIIKYCKNDCLEVANIVTKFLNKTGRKVKKPTSILTFGSLSMHYLDAYRAGKKQSRLPRLSIEEDSIIRPFFRGGMVCLSRKGASDNTYSYDINSAYLTVMSSPNGIPFCGIVELNDPEEIKRSIYNPFTNKSILSSAKLASRVDHIIKYNNVFLECSLRFIAPGPYFPIKYQHSELYPSDGLFRIRISLSELILAIIFNRVSTIEYTVHKIVIGTELYKLTDFAQDIYESRRAATNKHDERVDKTIGNSIFGYLGINPYKQLIYKALEFESSYVPSEDVVSEPRFGDIIFHTYHTDKPNIKNVLAAASIAAGSRSMLLYLIYLNKHNFLYCDTDCIHTAGPTKLGVFSEGSGLGDVKNEISGQKTYYSSKKIYYSEGNDRPKAKGGVITIPQSIELSLTDNVVKTAKYYSIEKSIDGEYNSFNVQSHTRRLKGEDHYLKTLELERLAAKSEYNNYDT